MLCKIFLMQLTQRNLFLFLYNGQQSFYSYYHTLQTSNGVLQRQLSGKTNYGSVDTPLPTRVPAPPGSTPPENAAHQSLVTSSNPFVSAGTNPFRQETVQPQAQDTYMHGTIEDRTY